MKWLVAVLVCGCGRINFEATSDAGGVPSDADADATCWDLWRSETVAFAPPTLVSVLSTTQIENNPYLASDGLHLYFNRGIGGMRDVHLSLRTAMDQPFAPPTALTAINSAQDDARLAVTSDFSYGVLASIRTGGTGNFDLYSVTSTDGGNTFGAPTQMYMGAVNTADFEGSPEISEDGLRLYFAYVMGANPANLYVAERATTTSAFGAPALVTGLDMSLHVSDLALSPDELVGVFTINNVDTDLFYATRATRAAPFGTPVLITDLNTPDANDDDPTVSLDGCELIFSSDRVANADLYRATVLR